MVYLTIDQTVWTDSNYKPGIDYKYDVSGNRVFIEFINPDISYNFSFRKQVAIDILVVGGGGASGGVVRFNNSNIFPGGGGGAGGVTIQNNVNIVTNTNYSASVGSKGIASSTASSDATSSNFNNTYYANPGEQGGALYPPYTYNRGGVSGNGNAGGALPYNPGVDTVHGGGNNYGIFIFSARLATGGGGAGGAGGNHTQDTTYAIIDTAYNANVYDIRDNYGGNGVVWEINQTAYGFGGPGLDSGEELPLGFSRDYFPKTSNYGNGGSTKSYNNNSVPREGLPGNNGNSGVVIISYILPSATLSNFPDLQSSCGVVPFNLTNPTSNSEGTFRFTSSNTNVADISGNTVTIKNVGTTTITATQNPNRVYSGGTIYATLTVEKGDPTIEPINIQRNYGDLPFTLNPTSNSTGTLSFTISDSRVADISGNTVTIKGVGSDSIWITQQETNNFYEGFQIGRITITKSFPTIKFNDFILNYGDKPFNLLSLVSSNSTGTLSFTNTNYLFAVLIPNNDKFDQSVATINGNIVTVHKFGTTAIRVIQAESPYFRSSYKDVILTVAPLVSSSTVKFGDTKLTTFKMGTGSSITIPQGVRPPARVTTKRVGKNLIVMIHK
jgi:hypothetical protein